MVIALQLVGAVVLPGSAMAQGELPDLVGYVVQAGSTADATAAARDLGVEPTVTFDQAFAGSRPG